MNNTNLLKCADIKLVWAASRTAKVKCYSDLEQVIAVCKYAAGLGYAHVDGVPSLDDDKRAILKALGYELHAPHYYGGATGQAWIVYGWAPIDTWADDGIEYEEALAKFKAGGSDA